MKLIHWVVTFSVASTAWAYPHNHVVSTAQGNTQMNQGNRQFLNASTAQGHPQLPMGFFAKFGRSFVPLTDCDCENNGVRSNLIIHGADIIIPTEFTFQDGYAVKVDSSLPGKKECMRFCKGSLGYDSGINKVKLVLDKQMKISNKKFKSCALVDDVLYSIEENENIIPEGECVEVDIYFWPYDKKTGYPRPVNTKKKGKPVKNEKQFLPELVDDPKIFGLEKRNTYQYSSFRPLVLFAKINGDYIPLSGTLFKDSNFNVTLLSYDVPNVSPVDFVFDVKKAKSNHYYTPGPLGVHRGMLAFSPKVSPVDWDWDFNHQVFNYRFASCKIFNDSVRVIFATPSHIPQRDCFEVEIYLMPYDVYTGTVVKKIKGGNTNKIPDTENHGRSSFPMVFFIKFNGYMVPLSGRYLGRSFKAISRLTYGDSTKPPVQFYLQGKNAFTNTSIPRFVGFERLMLSFGPSISPFDFHLNSDGKVNGSFYSCENWGIVMRDIVIGECCAGYAACCRVELYLLPYNEETKSQVKFC